MNASEDKCRLTIVYSTTTTRLRSPGDVYDRPVFRNVTYYTDADVNLVWSSMVYQGVDFLCSNINKYEQGVDFLWSNINTSKVWLPLVLYRFRILLYYCRIFVLPVGHRGPILGSGVCF